MGEDTMDSSWELRNMTENGKMRDELHSLRAKLTLAVGALEKIAFSHSLYESVEGLTKIAQQCLEKLKEEE